MSAALVLLLLALGTGLGLSSVSPWSNVGASTSTIGTAVIIWLILMEVVSSSMGGYLAGRLRTKWASIHTDEVYFRDTAHGFLAWALALVVTAAFLTSATSAMVGAPTSGSNRGDGRESSSSDYFVDTMFRSDSATVPTNSAPLNHAELERVFTNALKSGNIAESDKNYLVQQVSTKTGLSPTDAQKRVSDVFAAAQQAAETARKALAHSLLWIFIALLIGAFCASFAATIGGRQRDGVVIV